MVLLPKRLEVPSDNVCLMTHQSPISLAVNCSTWVGRLAALEELTLLVLLNLMVFRLF